METNTSYEQAKKFLAMAVENMPRMSKDVMQGWIENPQGLKKVLAEALLPPQKFEVWKTVKLGGFRNTDSIHAAIKLAGMNIRNYTEDILRNISLALKETGVDLVVISTEDLGFKSKVSYEEICLRAEDLGLKMCPAEVGPQLRLQYVDQPKGQQLIIAMKPIVDSDGDLGLFGVGRYDGGLWLDSHYGLSDEFWYHNSKFVFVLPQVK